MPKSPLVTLTLCSTLLFSYLARYLTRALPDRPKGQLHLIIAGTAVAAGLFNEREIENDIVERIPMRLSRTKKALLGVEIVIDEPNKL